MSTNTLRSIKSNVELSSVHTRRPSISPHDNWAANGGADPRGSSAKSAWFAIKYGKKHHAFWNVPWPLCYDREILDLDVLNYQFLKKLKGLTFVDLKSPPMRVLDVGTGLGSWILDAAQQWPDSEFIGLDVVPIQPDLDAIALDSSIRKRIQWVNGNFLQKLPFPDGFFNHVRCCSIAKGVPENKWGSFFEEIARVMAPGASLEVVVENIVFPYIPRIAPQAPSPVTTSPASPFSGGFTGLPRHDHYFLEQIFFDLFERRFVNIQPTKILKNYLNMHFRSVTEAPIRLDIPHGEEGAAGMRMPSRATYSKDGLSAWSTELRAWQCVIGCKEMMWEEVQLKSKDLGGDILSSLPWNEREQDMSSRQRFEILFNRYEKEMRERTGLSLALKRVLGWNEPGQESSSSLEVLEGGLDELDKERIRLSQSSSEDIDPDSQVSCFFGFKGEGF